MSDEGGPLRTLYVGNLDPAVTEELLFMLFSPFGSCKDCKIIREVGHDPYAFVKFSEHSDTQAALMAMNKRNVLGKELKVNWATSPGSGGKQDTSNHFHVYVGDLSPDIDSFQLRNAFSPFGEISDCKVIRDPHTHMSKGYAFVCFVRKEEAENAISTMNGQWLGGRTIRTNWASGKGNTPTTTTTSARSVGRPMLNYDEVYNQASPTNATVYCGGIQTGLTEEILKEAFSEYGTVADIRIFKDKCFAFVKMDSKDAACNAIVGIHGSEINGYTVRCSWGKEQSDFPSKSSSTSAQPSLPQQGPQQPQSSASSQQMPGGYDPMAYYNQQMAAYWGYPGYPQGGYPQGYMQGYNQAYGYGGNYGQQQQPNQQQWQQPQSGAAPQPGYNGQ